MEKETVLFDLDGTIIDSSKGIYASINFALSKLGKEEPSGDILKSFIGPPLMESFIGLGLSLEEAQLAVRYYRELYQREAVYNVIPYSGIEKTLMELSEVKEIFVATSKPEYFAVKILEHLDFAQYFKGIYGADLEGARSEKAAVIDYALSTERMNNRSEVVMIGDRKHDILGAKEHGLASIGVLYGFGNKVELEEAGADQLISQPLELLNVIK